MLISFSVLQMPVCSEYHWPLLTARPPQRPNIRFKALRQDSRVNITGDVRQAEVATSVFECQPFVIQAHQM